MQAAAPDTGPDATRDAVRGMDADLTAVADNLWRFGEVEVGDVDDPPGVSASGELLGATNPDVECESMDELVTPINRYLCRPVEVEVEIAMQPDVESAVLAAAEKSVPETPAEAGFIRNWKNRTS